ncbi:MAG: prenyltransferase [Anaerolineae bacterium]|nr:prenyltransferase [Anaerolineae bacterium]
MQQHIATKTVSLIRLTRWKEFVPFTVPVTVFAALLSGQPLDWRLVAVTAANILAVAYAFMINDIEDAPDDSRDPARAARNPIAMGELSIRSGWTASMLVAFLSLVLYACGGWWVLGIGVLTVLLSHFYSWKPIRLKAWPVADVTSHSLMLSGLLFLAGYFTYDVNPGWVWLVMLAVTLVSIYGQLYNQLRDYEIDKAAGLHNTAIIVGERMTRLLMYLCVALAIVFFLSAFALGVLPIWLPFVGVGVFAVVMYVYRPGMDMRGGQVADTSGNIQIQFLITANATVALWLALALVG